MRYWLLSFTIAVMAISVGLLPEGPAHVSAQVKDKKKDPLKDKKDPFKDKKDKKDDKDKKDVPEFKEPSDVMGKSFEYWKAKIQSVDPSEREQAIKSVLLFGPKKSYETIDDLISWLNKQKNQDVDLSFRVNAIQGLSTIFKYKGDPEKKHVKEALAIYRYYMKDPQVVMRLNALKGLPYIGQDSRAAIPDVVKLVKDPMSWEIRKEAIPVLVLLCAPPAKDQPPADSAWVTVLHDRTDWKIERSHQVRMVALQGIATLGKGVPNEMVRSLGDPLPVVKLTSLQCIAAMSHQMDGESKNIARARIKEFLVVEKDAALNMWAHMALMTIDKTMNKKLTKEELEPIIRRLNQNKDASLRHLSLQMMGMMGPEGKPMVLANVVEAVHDPDINVGVAAIQALIMMQAWETKPMLKKIVEDKKSNDVLHDAAVHALDLFDQQEHFIEEMKAKEKANKDKKSDK